MVISKGICNVGIIDIFQMITGNNVIFLLLGRLFNGVNIKQTHKTIKLIAMVDVEGSMTILIIQQWLHACMFFKIH